MTWDLPERPATNCSVVMEVPGSAVPQRAAPTSQPVQMDSEQPMIDVVMELAKWRKARKAAYEEEVRKRLRQGMPSGLHDGCAADGEVYVEGHWKGEVKVVRDDKPRNRGKLERTGNVDVFGNYFEGGYLYP